MRLMSSAYQNEDAIPKRFTCEGDNISPELHWKDAPRETKAFVLILHDPDAPKANGYAHWVLYDIPANATRIIENIPKDRLVTDLGVQGKNDAGKVGYTGPCPPSGTHRYFATLYALREQLRLDPGATRQQVISALDGKVIEQTELMGTYAKAGSKTEVHRA